MHDFLENAFFQMIFPSEKKLCRVGEVGRRAKKIRDWKLAPPRMIQV